MSREQFDIFAAHLLLFKKAVESEGIRLSRVVVKPGPFMLDNVTMFGVEIEVQDDER